MLQAVACHAQPCALPLYVRGFIVYVKFQNCIQMLICKQGQQNFGSFTGPAVKDVKIPTRAKEQLHSSGFAYAWEKIPTYHESIV